MTRLTHVAPVVLPILSMTDLEKAARIGFEEGYDTAETARLINERIACEPVTEADIANALARVRDGATAAL